MSNSKKVVKINRDIKINAATILIAAILLYIIICIILAAKKEPVTTYKVNKTDVSNNIMLDGLIIRDEIVLNTDKSGYVCYYIRDGEKIKKNQTICTIDETGQMINSLSESDAYSSLLTAEDYRDIRDSISLYKSNYSNTSFYEVYNFENSINNKVLELINEILMQQIQNSDLKISLSSIYAPDTGIITYYMDGYESFDIQSINKSAFDKSAYKKETLKSGDIVAANSPIIKLIPDETWYIFAPISQEQIALLGEDTYVSFKINNSSYTIDMPFEILYQNDGAYIKITLDKYLSNFVSERFVTVEILMQQDSGLKVPVSALVDKTVYKIPIGFFSAGGNQTVANKVNIQVKSDSGDITLKQITPTIYMTDEEYCYVDPNIFQASDVLLNITTNESLAISLVSSDVIKGVYSANRGTAEFKKVSVIKFVDEFALINADEEINAFDNIILDSSKVKENQIIY